MCVAYAECNIQMSNEIAIRMAVAQNLLILKASFENFSDVSRNSSQELAHIVLYHSDQAQK